MAVQTSAGSTFSIATGAPATNDGTGFTALTYVVVGEITDLASVGREYVTVPFSPVGSRGTQKFKGSYHNGSMQIKMGRSATNAGQVAVKAALLSDADYSFKVTLQDLTKIHFTGKVTKYVTSIGSVDQITSAECTVELNSTDIVEI